MRTMGVIVGVLLCVVSAPVRAQRLGPEDYLTSFGPQLQEPPIVVAGSDRGYLAVFMRPVGATWELVTHPLDAMARPSVGTGLTIRTYSRAPIQLALTATADQYGLIVLETGTGAATFLRLTRTGELETGETPLGTSRRNVALTWNGTHFLTLVSDGANAVWAQRLDEIGQRVDATPRMLGTARDMAAASDGDGYLFLHQDTTGLRATRLDRELVPIDSVPFIVRDHPIAEVAAGFDGVQYIVAWSEGDSLYEPRVARISPGGEVLDTGGVSLAPPGERLELSLAARPRQSLVAWATMPASGTRYTNVAAFSAGGTTRGGVSVAAAEVTVPAGGRLQGVAVAGDTYGTVVFAQNLEGFSNMRFRVRPVLDDTLGSTCVMAGDCASGFCVDGRCCNSACEGTCEACRTGTCEPEVVGTECRAASGPCDSAEACDGVSATCPDPVDVSCGGDSGAPMDAGAVPSASTGGCTVSRIQVGVGSVRTLFFSLLLMAWARRLLQARRRAAKP